MGAQYSTRAVAIHELVIQLRRRLEIASVGTVTDKMALIDLGVEVVNKVLYCFLVSQELFDQVESCINPKYRKLSPNPNVINRFFVTLLGVVRSLEESARFWVQKYA